MPRFYCPVGLATGESLALPAGAARHVQVLRLQPGNAITLFNGLEASPGEFEATVTRIGRSEVEVILGGYSAVQREAVRTVHLAVGMPANDRMDWLVEKATELGVASIQPLITERSVLRLSGERADRKQAHWQSVAIAACEQCGRNRVPVVHPVVALAQWLKAPASGQRFLLSLREGSQPLQALVTGQATRYDEASVLSGPEGGLNDSEEQAALSRGFAGVSLGPRVLRAETAALAALTLLS